MGTTRYPSFQTITFVSITSTSSRHSSGPSISRSHGADLLPLYPLLFTWHDAWLTRFIYG